MRRGSVERWSGRRAIAIASSPRRLEAPAPLFADRFSSCRAPLYLSSVASFHAPFPEENVSRNATSPVTEGSANGWTSAAEATDAPSASPARTRDETRIVEWGAGGRLPSRHSVAVRRRDWSRAFSYARQSERA
eukprot:31273-Pelagococcus_subviridis.AAC.4